ncbi:MAG: Ohr subfamily peroxiredoxin [Rickettsiales bacterium]|jgi:Ohr subfamily peroxiredoxin
MTSPNKILYKTKVSSQGGRANGHSKSEDGRLEVELSTPKEMGGDGGQGTNPEQLFGAGYSACFLGAVKAVAGKEKIKLSEESSVTAEIGFGPLDHGYAITASLEVDLPDLDTDVAQDLIDKAHQVCPYSNATRNNVDVKISLK